MELVQDWGRRSDEKMSRKIGNVQSRTTFFRRSAVLSLPADLLRRLPTVLLFGTRVQAAKCETQKPSTCRETLFFF